MCWSWFFLTLFEIIYRLLNRYKLLFKVRDFLEYQVLHQIEPLTSNDLSRFNPLDFLLEILNQIKKCLKITSCWLKWDLSRWCRTVDWKGGILEIRNTITLFAVHFFLIESWKEWAEVEDTVLVCIIINEILWNTFSLIPIRLLFLHVWLARRSNRSWINVFHL